MNTKFRLLLGVCLIACAIFWNDLGKIIPTIPDNNVPTIDIKKPNSVSIEEWQAVAESITDPEDKVRLCVFNKVFAERILGYDATAQQVNDIYVLAASYIFGDTLRGKYDDLGIAIRDAMISVLGEENHEIIETEKLELSKRFMAFAWCLNNR